MCSSTREEGNKQAILRIRKSRVSNQRVDGMTYLGNTHVNTHRRTYPNTHTEYSAIVSANKEVLGRKRLTVKVI